MLSVFLSKVLSLAVIHHPVFLFQLSRSFRALRQSVSHPMSWAQIISEFVLQSGVLVDRRCFQSQAIVLYWQL